ncbi:hypothetical protein BJ170DRAFT_680999 [Xylariales sp. AK1849]|nr:hypothetical protein BJ170DRAFT_680999 [Xylariales sp. AK1849]
MADHWDLGSLGKENPSRRDQERQSTKMLRDGARSPDREARSKRRQDDGRRRRARSPEPEAARQRSKRDDNQRERRALDNTGTKQHHSTSHRRVSPSHAAARDRQPKRSRSSSSTRLYPHRRQRRSSTHSYHSYYSPGELPFSSRPLSKADFYAFRPLLARYLEVQKNKNIANLDEREVRGRWKSFMSKWNEGTLAEGWYSPELFEKTREIGLPSESEAKAMRGRGIPTRPQGRRSFEGLGEENEAVPAVFEESEDEDDDGYGPVLPGSRPHERSHDHAGGRAARQGPGIPDFQDLEVKREMAEEDRLERTERLRLERKADRAEQKTRLEDLVPRAEAGTRERQLEKKKEVNEKMKGFRERSPGAAEVNDKELMGGSESVDELKRMKASAERKKTEREVRREEIQRARAAERDERIREYREKEDKAMIVLKELARQKFG